MAGYAQSGGDGDEYQSQQRQRKRQSKRLQEKRVQDCYDNETCATEDKDAQARPNAEQQQGHGFSGKDQGGKEVVIIETQPECGQQQQRSTQDGGSLAGAKMLRQRLVTHEQWSYYREEAGRA